MAKGRQKLRQIPIVQSMLAVVGLGACLGVGLAWMQWRAEEKKLKEVQQIPEKLSPVLFPEASSPPLLPSEEPQPQPELKVPSAMERLPVYPGSLPQAFDSVVADGKPIDMAWFSTEDSVEQLRAFYAKEFALRGIFFVSHEFSPYAGYIGHIDWANQELHLVSYIRQGRQTMVFPSRSSPAQQMEGGQLPEGVPVHPKASLAKTIAFFEPEGRQRLSYSATVPNESLASVKGFFQEALLAKGLKNIQEKEERGRVSLEASNEQRVLNFSFEQKQNDVGIYLLLMGQSPER